MNAHSQRGFTTIEYVVATALSLVLFVLIANLLVDLYERGAARDALDEGARAAVPVGSSPAECERTARATLQALAPRLRGAEVSCADVGDRVFAAGRVTLPSWLPMLVPDWHLELHAAATRER